MLKLTASNVIDCTCAEDIVFLEVIKKDGTREMYNVEDLIPADYGFLRVENIGIYNKGSFRPEMVITVYEGN